MKLLFVSLVLVMITSACGVVQSAATSELRDVSESGTFAPWEVISLDTPPDISLPADAPPLAVVVWTERYDNERTLDDVYTIGQCDPGCDNAIESYMSTGLSDLGYVAGWSICGLCDSVPRTSLLTIDGALVTEIGREDIIDYLGLIDTPYEAMLVLGERSRVRPDRDNWRVVVTRVASDCDPYTIEWTMWALDADGTKTQVAQFDISDDSCV